MARRCTICDNAARAAIEAALIGGEPESVDQVAKRFGVSKWALGRHRRNHMDRPASLAQTQEKVPSVIGELTGTPQQRMNKLIEIAAGLLARAVKQSSVDTQIRGLGELRKVVELMEKVAGRMPPDAKTEILHIHYPESSQMCPRCKAIDVED